MLTMKDLERDLNKAENFYGKYRPNGKYRKCVQQSTDGKHMVIVLNELTKTDVQLLTMSGADEKVLVKGECGHEWKLPVYNIYYGITWEGFRCPVCGDYRRGK